MTQHYVFVMDPVTAVLVNEDTSFSLMLEAEHRGHRVSHCQPQDLYLRDGTLYARVAPATMQRLASAPIILGEHEDICLHDVDAVFVRKDPPFDSNYLYCTLMLEHVMGQTLVVNRPAGLRAANEKLYTCMFPELMPATLVSNDKARIRRFVGEIGGKAVIKPLDGAGGEGVMALLEGDLNFNAIVEATTRHGQRVAMVQEFLPEVQQGDKRILLLDGEPLGAILRVPQTGDMRSNIHVGGQVQRATLSEADHRIIEAIAPRLEADGLFFVGLDVIGERLTEVNVTSPTGIQQMSRLDNENYSARVISWAEVHAQSLEQGK